MDIEEIIGEAEPPQTSVTICIRGDLVAKWEQVHAEFTRAPDVAPSLGERSPRAQLAAQLRELDEEMKGAQRTFVFKAMPATQFSALMAKYPPKGAEVGILSFDSETMRIPLIAASSVNPAMTEAQMTRLCERLSRGQILQLGNAAYQANQGGVDIPFDGAVYAESQGSDGS